ncbi:GNAT family N-acetyltransferase [Hyphococcus sp.]|uniref:GNAT family N-acetyltransferase n=1 Tax=Hyphococcus sp. TaxID=2038636 RepID=UPI00208D491B|nr:MAG: N-acetyltransferase [Marinicaulis sp.]
MEFNVIEQTEADWREVWRVIEPAFRAGESYPLPRDVSEASAKRYWTKLDGYNAIARDGAGEVIGVYYLRPDQGGPGDHICNAGYVIAESARGKGYASALCLQSQEQARRMGFRGMKFNLVVAANAAAIKAWKRAGMEIIGTVPGAFRHPTRGTVDAHIMFKAL